MDETFYFVGVPTKPVHAVFPPDADRPYMSYRGMGDMAFFMIKAVSPEDALDKAVSWMPPGTEAEGVAQVGTICDMKRVSVR